MSTFQLYDNLNKNIPKKDMSTEEKQKLVDLIPSLDQQATELVFALITHHNNKDKKAKEYKKIVKTNNIRGTSNITWNLKDLPIKLRHILYKFLCMEETRMNEMDDREINQIKMKNKHVV